MLAMRMIVMTTWVTGLISRSSSTSATIRSCDFTLFCFESCEDFDTVLRDALQTLLLTPECVCFRYFDTLLLFTFFEMACSCEQF